MLALVPMMTVCNKSPCMFIHFSLDNSAHYLLKNKGAPLVHIECGTVLQVGVAGFFGDRKLMEFLPISQCDVAVQNSLLINPMNSLW